MRELGFIQKWTKENAADVGRCLNNNKHAENEISPLTLQNLFGVFLVLIFGVIASVLYFCAEMIYHWIKQKIFH